MRTSHCSKTYQLAAAEVTNSACFQRFSGKITGIPRFRGHISPTADGPSASAGPRSTCISPAAGRTRVGVRRRCARRVVRSTIALRPGHLLPGPVGLSGSSCMASSGGTRAGRSFDGMWARGMAAAYCCGLNAGEPPTWWLEALDRVNLCPAVTYSPTPSRVQYHRRCGS